MGGVWGAMEGRVIDATLMPGHGPLLRLAPSHFTPLLLSLSLPQSPSTPRSNTSLCHTTPLSPPSPPLLSLSLSLSHHHLSLSPPDPQHASFAHLSHIPISHHPPPSPPLHLTYQLHTLTPLTSSLLSPSTDPQHASFAQLLEAPRIDARAIIRARFPSPRLVDCDQNGSQSRFLLAKLNPSATYSNIAGATGEVIMVRAWVGSSDVRR